MTFARTVRRAAIPAALLAVAALAAAPVLAANVPVGIAGKAFTPAEIIVHQGDTVTWTVTQAIGEPHSVTSGKPDDASSGDLFDSGLEVLKNGGGSFQFTFAQPGTFDYFCLVHATEMTGVVVVQPAGVEAPGEGGGHEGVPAENKLVAAGLLVASIIVLFGAALVWRRMNPA